MDENKEELEEEIKEVHKGVKPQEKVERFFVRPQYQPIFGVEVTKDTDIDDVTEDGSVHQTIKDLVFTTETHRTVEDGTEDFESIEETSIITVKLKEGCRLIWQDKIRIHATRFAHDEIKRDYARL